MRKFVLALCGVNAFTHVVLQFANAAFAVGVGVCNPLVRPRAETSTVEPGRSCLMYERGCAAVCIVGGGRQGIAFSSHGAFERVRNPCEA